MMKRLTPIFPLLLLAVSVAACDEATNGSRVVGELASDRIELSAQVSESVEAILVEEGQSVAAGTELLRQASGRAQAVLAEAQAGLAQARARLDELVRGPRSEQITAARANLEGATTDLEFREAEYARAREVHAKGLASPEFLDRATANLEAAKANLDLRQAQLAELLTGTTVEELAQAESAVKQAAARRDAAQVELDRHTIVASADGVVDSRLVELGETPSPGQPLIIMLGGEQVYARVFVPEILRVQVSSGTPALVYVDGMQDALDGRVRWVSAESAFTPYYALTERDRGRLSYMAKIDIEGAGKRLPDGVPVEVEFLLDSGDGRD